MGADPMDVMLAFVAGDWKRLGYKSKTHTIGKDLMGRPIKVDVISPEMRLGAAIKAAPYFYPMRKPVDAKGNADDKPQTIEVKNVWTIKQGNAEKLIEQKDVIDVVAEYYDKDKQA